MTDQLHLPIKGAVEAFALSGHRDAWGRWTLSVARRGESQDPTEWARSGYEALSTAELADVVDAELGWLL